MKIKTWEDHMEEVEEQIDRITALIDDGDESEDLQLELEYWQEQYQELEEDLARAQADAWADELKDREREFWSTRF